MFTLRTLGHNGRFGNQLFQYCFAKGLAKHFNCELQVPSDWIGRKIFQIPEAGISVKLPATALDHIPYGPGYDLFGYWQYQKAIEFYSRTLAKEWLSLQPHLKERYSKPIRDTWIAIHRRFGDYRKLVMEGKLCIPGQESIWKVCTEHKLSDYTVWVDEENKVPKVFDFPPMPQVNSFATNDNFLYSDIAFLDDFMILAKATTLVRTNSTFSWWAHVLAEPTQEVYAPIVTGKYGYAEVDFVKGNHPCMVSAKSLTQTDLYLKD